jgi:hypothetical protein
MNGGFRAGITELDPHRIDAGILASRQDGLAGLPNQCFINAASGHGCSYDFVTFYILRIYVLKLAVVKRGVIVKFR